MKARQLGVATILLASTAAAIPASGQATPECAPDNAGLTLPEGFCALVVADAVGRARHLTVADNGDVFVALARSRSADGGVLVLRDTDGDGTADRQERFGSGSGDDVQFHGAYLYYSTNSAVVRYRWQRGALKPTGPAETIVRGLPASGSHRAKSLAFGADGRMYVNVGSPGNVCQRSRREPEGKVPCDELENRAGIWQFDPDRTSQVQADGIRFATGVRNAVALAVRPQNDKLYAVVNGRDRLNAWPFYDNEQSAEKPSEEFIQIERGDDFGWPYCFHDTELGHKVLAPEYGGNGREVGRCRSAKAPVAVFPAHWAPLGLLFYTGNQFPERYHGGAFVTFHGSWNRAPLPQAGYLLAFVLFDGDVPAGGYDVFADGFAGAKKSPGGAEHRPVGIAQGPDGSIYVSDDRRGRIYRIVYLREE